MILAAHHAVLDARPAELAALQPLGEQAQTRAVPEDQLHSVGALRAEAEDHARERIGIQMLLHQRRKPVHPFAEVHGLRRHQNPDRSGRDQHSATHAFKRRTARKTASMSRVSMPPDTRTLMAPITISMKLGRRSCAAFFACADSTDTTGTNVGIRLSAAQMAGLIEGLDWMRVHARRVAAPEAVQ
jgi:hypothetical protein